MLLINSTISNKNLDEIKEFLTNNNKYAKVVRDTLTCELESIANINGNIYDIRRIIKETLTNNNLIDRLNDNRSKSLDLETNIVEYLNNKIKKYSTDKLDINKNIYICKYIESNIVHYGLFEGSFTTKGNISNKYYSKFKGILNYNNLKYYIYGYDSPKKVSL